VLHCSLGRASPAQPKMSGPGPAQSKKNKNIYIYFKKNLWFPRVFFTKFCLILICIFIS
jgi:hypothetical protein